ncbi:predicted protein [Uncinocarpus reesii 1704]|uniref:Secreted protein n=1 Tax=Uncinocarpus reesii (strain UAMH 1704) TaxID=336963 RepID=C4JPK3_UNCRE|nr:uncharacterized protein UREG_03175 [Uncinocarpus reesii 1704]EEP78329.1 predicted protein [Uncinocarpus reesii 1704]
MKPTLLLLGLAAESLAAAVLPGGAEEVQTEVTRTFEFPHLPTKPPHHPTRPPHHTNTRPPHWPTKPPHHTHTRPPHQSSTRTRKPWPTYHVDERDVIDDIVARDDASSDGPDPDHVHVVGITYGGSGCPQGSARTILSDDRETVTLIFDQFIAAIGPKISLEESRRNCQVNLKLQYPGGYQYSVLGVDYRGYAKLDRGVEGVHRSNYYYSGETNDFALTTWFDGPKNGDYFLHDDTDQTSRNWSPCGSSRALNINTSIRLSSRDKNASGLLTNDSTDADFRQIYHIKWRKC